MTRRIDFRGGPRDAGSPAPAPGRAAPEPATPGPVAREPATPAQQPVAPGPPARDSLRVTIEGIPPHVADLVPEPALRDEAAAAVRPLPPGRGQSVAARRVEVIVDGWRFEATVEPTRHAVLRERVQRHVSGPGGGQQVVRAPLPGRILRVWVATGDQVEPGSRLCSLEAMKMENEVLAHRAGTILRVGVAPGARVELGDELVVIA